MGPNELPKLNLVGAGLKWDTFVGDEPELLSDEAYAEAERAEAEWMADYQRSVLEAAETARPKASSPTLSGEDSRELLS
jgi:hypothetical protein